MCVLISYDCPSVIVVYVRVLCINILIVDSSGIAPSGIEVGDRIASNMAMPAECYACKQHDYGPLSALQWSVTWLWPSEYCTTYYHIIILILSYHSLINIISSLMWALTPNIFHNYYYHFYTINIIIHTIYYHLYYSIDPNVVRCPTDSSADGGMLWNPHSKHWTIIEIYHYYHLFHSLASYVCELDRNSNIGLCGLWINPWRTPVIVKMRGPIAFALVTNIYHVSYNLS